MVKQITFGKYLFLLMLILAFSIIFVGSKVYKEKEKLSIRINEKFEETSTIYSIFKNENDFHAGIDQIQRHSTNGIGKFNGKGFWMYIYEFSRFEPYQIIMKIFDIGKINYLKSQFKMERYYDIGEIEYDQHGFPHIVGSGYKEKLVKIEDNSPHDIYQSALEYYEKEMKKKGAIEYNDDLIKELSQEQNYYTLTFTTDTTFRGKQKYGNEYFEVDIISGIARRYEAKYIWDKISNSILFYFLLLSILPTIMIAYSNYNKIRFFIICFSINYIFLLLSVSDTLNLTQYYCISSYSIETVWPFTKEMFDIRNKIIFLGHADVGSYTTLGDKYLYAMYPLNGYDISEFIFYTIISYLIYRLFIKNKK